MTIRAQIKRWFLGDETNQEHATRPAYRDNAKLTDSADLDRTAVNELPEGGTSTRFPRAPNETTEESPEGSQENARKAG